MPFNVNPFDKNRSSSFRGIVFKTLSCLLITSSKLGFISYVYHKESLSIILIRAINLFWWRECICKILLGHFAGKRLQVM
jgi:hypothetical protein